MIVYGTSLAVLLVALKLGEIAKQIGAGRNSLEDKIDYEVGLVLTKKVGDYVEQEEVANCVT